MPTVPPVPPPKRVVLNVFANNRLLRLATSAIPFGVCLFAVGAAVGRGGGDTGGGILKLPPPNKPPIVRLLIISQRTKIINNPTLPWAITVDMRRCTS